ncbi:MAG TPA: translocation/assembly module TamB domain-containing protein, partial [Polyangiales bacterium]
MPRVRLELQLDTERQGDRRTFALRARDLKVNGDSIPDWVARGSFDGDGAHLTSLELPSWEAQHGQLQLDVQADYRGELSATLAASLPRVTPRSRLGQLSGLRSDALALRARARYHVAADRLEADASLRVANLRHGDLVVAQANASLNARGRLLRPQLSAELTARALKLGSVRVDALAASAKGGPTQYTISARARARNARAEADVQLLLGKHEQRVTGSGMVQGWVKQPVQLTLGDVRFRRDEIAIDNLRATAGSSVLALEGSYGRTRASDLHLRLEGLAFHVPLSSAAAGEPPTPGLRGHVGAHLHLTGNLERPDAELSLGSEDLTLAGRALGELRLIAGLRSRHHHAEAKLWLTGLEGDTLQLMADATLPAGGSLAARFDQAHYQLEARTKQSVARLFRQLLPQREPVPDGTLELAARLAGPWRKPLGELTLAGTRIAVPGERPFDAQLEAHVSEVESRASIAVTDALGPLASAHAHVQAQLWSLLDALRHERLRELRASYALHVAERQLSELPRVLRLDLPVAIKLDAELTTSPGGPPSARLAAEARYLKQEADARCKAFAAPRLSLSARIDEERFVAELYGDSADRRRLEASLAGATPRWSQLSKGQLERGLKVALTVRDLELESLPFLCADWAGRVSGSLRGEELLSERPKLAGQLHVRRARYAGSSSTDVSVGARADRLGLTVVGVDVRQADRHVLTADGTLPWRWDGGRDFALRAEQCRVKATLAQFPLADLSAVIQAIAQASGHVSGDISLSGCEDLSGLRGSLALQDAGFTIKDPLLRAEGLSAQVRLAPQLIELSALRLSDQGGVLKGHGRVQIERGRLSKGAFTFRATEFPLRTDARVSGYLDGDVDVALDWSSIPHRVAVSLDKIAVRLPQRAPHDSQPLARHADVTYVDMPATSGVAVDDEPGVPVELKLLTEQAFWVRGNELSAQLKLNLTILSGPEQVELRGTVNVVRGFLNLFSKGFDIERGTLVFDGSQRIDPTVSLDAVHKLGDGQTVTVHVRDRLSSPTVTFSTSVAGITSDAEILQMLVRGREASAAQTAQAQVGAALAGMTSELLGSLANTRVGKYVPVLSLEAGASSGTRLRAGVEANSLIPKKLRNVVEGAYVEGFVGSRNQGGNATATGGVLMELYFPKDLVTGGTWELPNNWNIELTWEP